MNYCRLSAFIVVSMFIFVATGCTPRSISNSGYPNSYQSRYDRDSDQNDFSYEGELTEFQILGIDPKSMPSEGDIARALSQSKNIKLSKNSKILLIQSGAAIPDEGMAKSLEKYFTVGPFSGKPQSDIKDENYSRLIRLIAAKGGYETIVCYWGILESGKMNQATKTVSWVPIVGWSLPDQKDLMRIRLKIALLDVRTGSWEVFMPAPFADSDYSAIANRKDVDQSLVQTLKEKAYVSAASEVYSRFSL